MPCYFRFLKPEVKHVNIGISYIETLLINPLSDASTKASIVVTETKKNACLSVKWECVSYQQRNYPIR